MSTEQISKKNKGKKRNIKFSAIFFSGWTIVSSKQAKMALLQFYFYYYFFCLNENRLFKI